MFKSFALKSTFAAGLAMVGALVLAPQEASAGRGGGFHGGGAPHVAAFHPAFHPAFRPAFHPMVRPAFHFAPRRASFGGYHAARGGFTRHAGRGMGERGMGGRGHEHSRFGGLEHGRHQHGGFGPGFYAPDYAEPDAAAYPTDTPVAAVGPDAAPLPGGAAPSQGPAPQPQIAKAASCAAPGSSVLVTFAPKATATDISNFLKAYNVTIVDGPSQDGRYRVRLSDKSLPPNEVMQAVQSMQSNSAIVSGVSVL